jgi:two-component sensor histidine kinase
MIFLCVAGWTVFVALALWWILRSDTGPTVWIAPAPESVQPAVAEKFRAWFKTGLGLERVYPWLLFGPYIFLLVSYFPVQRRRLRLSLPLNLAACAAFVAVSQPINNRTNAGRATIVIFDSRVKADASPLGYQTKAAQGELWESQPPDVLQDQISRRLFIQNWNNRTVSATITRKNQEATDRGSTNVVDELHEGFGLPPAPTGLQKWSPLSTLMDLLAYGAIAGLAHSVYFYRRLRERERRALVLESRLASSQLNALRAQLQPHFIFNSLNAIAALLRRDPRLAETTLLSLSDLLRLAFSRSEAQEITLREEMQFIDRYMELQQTRFGDKLRFQQEIEPAALDCFVPTLLLQPLVENAIRHGIEPADQEGLVRLMAQKLSGKLVMIVEDDGVGLKPGAPGSLAAVSNAGSADKNGCTRNGSGIGLSNLRARLETLYGTAQALEIAPRPEGGVTVRIEIPWHLVALTERAGASKES